MDVPPFCFLLEIWSFNVSFMSAAVCFSCFSHGHQTASGIFMPVHVSSRHHVDWICSTTHRLTHTKSFRNWSALYFGVSDKVCCFCRAAAWRCFDCLGRGKVHPRISDEKNVLPGQANKSSLLFCHQENHRIAEKPYELRTGWTSRWFSCTEMSCV